MLTRVAIAAPRKNGQTYSGRISFVDVDVVFADGDFDLDFAGRAGNLRSDDVLLSLLCLRDFMVMPMTILSSEVIWISTVLGMSTILWRYREDAPPWNRLYGLNSSCLTHRPVWPTRMGQEMSMGLSELIALLRQRFPEAPLGAAVYPPR
jgi:hypothetical protein